MIFLWSVVFGFSCWGWFRYIFSKWRVSGKIAMTGFCNFTFCIGRFEVLFFVTNVFAGIYIYLGYGLFF